MSCQGLSSTSEHVFEKIIHKVPGNPIQSKKEKQGYVNLVENSKFDLIELIERQDKLLKNKPFINRLPDKGEKILIFKNQLENELRNREKSDQLAEALSKLNINGKEALDKLEWTGSCNPGQSTSIDKNIYEHDDNLLKILASHSGSGFHKKINRILPAEPSLIKQSDIEGSDRVLAVSDGDDELSIEEPYVKNLCDRFDKLSDRIKVKEKFLPHKTINKTVDEVLKKNVDVENCKRSNWEVTAATPPPAVYKDVKLLPLEESVKLQIQQAEQFKKVQMKHATEKLKSMSGCGGVTMSINVPSGRSNNFGQFRDPDKDFNSGSEDENEQDDQQSFHSCQDEDEEADEKQGGITFYNLIDN